jgi:hypothetical protein
MYRQILEQLLARYGNLSYPELRKALREDGLGELLDAIESGDCLTDLTGLIGEIAEELPQDVFDHVFGDGDAAYGVMPSSVHLVPSIPVEYEGTFAFDSQACLRSCKGNCCRNKNYLMINIADIFDILSSRGARVFGIRSTTDLFDHEPPFVELFYVEEYAFFLPYIRFLPVDADAFTRPEDAEENVCPFLRPIHEVYAHHGKILPPWAAEDAWGCMLMEAKPLICRLSPLGRCCGMETGRVTYEYARPAVDCPAFDTDVEVKVSDYISSIESPSERERQKRLHEVLMGLHHAGACGERNTGRFHEIVREVYNIDRLLAHYGLDVTHRPPVDSLIQMVLEASRGDFSRYEEFTEGLRNKGRRHRDRQRSPA